MIVKIDETRFEEALKDIEEQIEKTCDDTESTYMILHAVRNAYLSAKYAAQEDGDVTF